MDLPLIVVVGAGPVGLSFAIHLAEYSWLNIGKRYRIHIYERRIRLNQQNRYVWMDLPDGNRRREQVVTLQTQMASRSS